MQNPEEQELPDEQNDETPRESSLNEDRNNFNIRIHKTADGYEAEFEIDKEVYKLMAYYADELGVSVSAVFNAVFTMRVEDYQEGREHVPFSFTEAEHDERIVMLRSHLEMHSDESHGLDPWKESYSFNGGHTLEETYIPLQADEEEY